MGLWKRRREEAVEEDDASDPTPRDQDRRLRRLRKKAQKAARTAAPKASTRPPAESDAALEEDAPADPAPAEAEADDHEALSRKDRRRLARLRRKARR